MGTNENRDTLVDLPPDNFEEAMDVMINNLLITKKKYTMLKELAAKFGKSVEQLRGAPSVKKINKITGQLDRTAIANLRRLGVPDSMIEQLEIVDEDAVKDLGFDS